MNIEKIKVGVVGILITLLTSLIVSYSINLIYYKVNNSSVTLKTKSKELYANTYSSLNDRVTALETYYNNVLGAKKNGSNTTSYAKGICTSGSSLSLSTGTYILVGEAVFASNAAITARQVNLYNSNYCSGGLGSNPVLLDSSNTTGNSALNTAGIVALTSSETYYTNHSHNVTSSISVTSNIASVQLK